jgi:hypothetical protein
MNVRMVTYKGLYGKLQLTRRMTRYCLYVMISSIVYKNKIV